MEVSCQLRTPIALNAGVDPTVPLG